MVTMLQVKNKVLYQNVLAHIRAEGLEVPRLGNVPVMELINNGKIKDVADIYYLLPSDFQKIGYSPEQSVDMVNSIQANVGCSICRFLMGLNITGMTLEIAKDIEATLGANWLTLLQKDEGFKTNLPQEVRDSINEVLSNIEDNGIEDLIHIMRPTHECNRNALVPLAFLYKMGTEASRKIRKLLPSYGMREAKFLSEKTKYMLIGNEREYYSSKARTAHSLGIAVLLYTDFIELQDRTNLNKR